MRNWHLALCLAVVQTLGLPNFSPAAESEQPQSVILLAPLSTLVSAPHWPKNFQGSIHVSLSVADDAPDDLGVGAWVSDFDGTWYQQLQLQPLAPGRHSLRFPLTDGHWQAVGHDATWHQAVLPELRRGGILFWSQQSSRASITIHSWRLENTEAASGGPPPPLRHLENLQLPDMNAQGQWQGFTGQRTSLTFQATPQALNPYDPGSFAAYAIFICQESGRSEHIPAFWQIPKQRRDRGDQEYTVASQGGHFTVRWRPRLPGIYQVQLRAYWQQSQLRDHSQLASSLEPCVQIDLPPLVVEGQAWDDYVRVDPKDSRFFHIDGAFYWPIGINIRSVNDGRGARRTGSQVTPDRGIHSYEDYLQRFAAAGGNAIEIWMSSWNLALEWRDDWPEFRGLGRYSQAKAQRLDDLLDLAYDLGIRVNLVVRNHGQGSERTDREWHNSPFNSDLGGVVDGAAAFFYDQQALAYQHRYHRYLIARYADHPAILAWKLWSEVDLTAGRRSDVRRWHEHTSAQFHRMDVYGHPVTTHWSGDFRRPDRQIVAQDGICFVCIDAYHGRRDGQGEMIHRLLWRSTQSPAPGQGLHQFGKPVLVTEYGGNWNAAPIPQLIAEHHGGPWAALIAGHAGSPMLWWFEWVDQNDLWAPYHALSAFLAGEDLRSSQARARILRTGNNQLWGGSWVRPDRVIGYVVYQPWGFAGSESNDPQTARLRIEQPQDKATTWRWQWWDADRGQIVAEESVRAEDGVLTANTPPFHRHLAFKLFPDQSNDD